VKILYHHRIRSKDGQYVHIEEMIGALRKLGHEIILAGPSAVEKEEFGSEAGIVAVLKRYLPQFIYELLELAYALMDYRRLVRMAKQHKPDCLYERYNLFLPSGVWLRRRFKLPMLLEVNAPLYDERKKYNGIALDRVARWTEHYAWRGADYVLPVTRVLASYVQRANVPETRIVVIPNGINTEKFSRKMDTGKAKAALGLEGRLVLGFVGFMREWHGLERVIELLAREDDMNRHLLLVGDGPVRDKLLALARSLGISDRVTITGVIARGQVMNYIAAFDVALQPEVVEYASPLKLFEYLALGRAIVAPDAPNLMEILRDGSNALLFRRGDATAFAAAVERICRDSGLRAHLSEGAARTIAQRGLTWDSNARRVVRLFEKLGVKNEPESGKDAPARQDASPKLTVSD
jgi:glycosyltransferase involved in cell wall biosynthesis